MRFDNAEQLIEWMENLRCPWYIRLCDTFKNMKWWILYRFHPSHRYHVIKTGYPPGYVDPHYVLESVIVQVLFDFMENERKELIDGTMNFEYYHPNDIARFKRLKEIYEYFKANDVKEFLIDDNDLTKLLTEIVELRDLMWS